LPDGLTDVFLFLMTLQHSSDLATRSPAADNADDIQSQHPPLLDEEFEDFVANAESRNDVSFFTAVPEIIEIDDSEDSPSTAPEIIDFFPLASNELYT
jgi:hypothetical protein